MRHYRSQCSVWLILLNWLNLCDPSEWRYWQGSENCKGKWIAKEVKLSEKWKEAMAHDCGDVFYYLPKKGEVILVVITTKKKDGKERVESKHIQIWHGLLFWWRSQVLMRILCKMLNDDYMYTFQLLEYHMGHMRKRGHRAGWVNMISLRSSQKGVWSPGLGTPSPSKTDEFSEKFQKGGGSFSIQKFILQNLDL